MATVHHCSDWECNVLPLNVKSEFPELMKNPRISKNEKLGFLSLCKFSESVTVDELLDVLVVSDEPLKLVLIDAISVGTAELVDDSVETRFGGVGPPTTIKDANEVITHLSDLVTMQVHSRETSVISAHASVSVSPVLACLDGGVHQFLNLTHDDDSEGVRLNLQQCSESRHGSKVNTCLNLATQVVQTVEAVVLLDHGAVQSTLKVLKESECLSGSEGDLDVVAHGRCGCQQNQYKADGALGQDLSASSSGVPDVPFDYNVRWLT